MGALTGEIGAFVDPDVIDNERINVDSLYRVVATLDGAEIEQFEEDVRRFDQGGGKSALLLWVLALAAGYETPRNNRAMIYAIQDNVVGVSFLLDQERR